MSERSKYTIELQRAICWSGFNEPHNFVDIIPVLSISDFPDFEYRAIYSALADLIEAGTKPKQLAALTLDELKNRDVYDKIGGHAFLAGLIVGNDIDATGIVGNRARALKKVNALEKLRLLLSLEISSEAQKDSSDPDELLAKFDSGRTVIECGSSSDDLVHVADASLNAISRQREAKLNGTELGMPTGFATWDEATGGFHRGQLILLSARTFAGKTAIALNLARYFGLKKRPTLFCCLEMKDFELAERVLSIDADISLHQWASGDLTEADFNRLEATAERHREWPMMFSKSTSETVSKIRGKARLAKSRMGGLDLLVVDHLQRLTADDPREQRHRQLIEITHRLKDLAQQLDCAVLLLSQLKTDNDGEPTEADYSEAKGILQEADQAYLMHRKKDDDFAEKICIKNRKGCATRFKLDFEGRFQRFTDQPTSNPWPVKRQRE